MDEKAYQEIVRARVRLMRFQPFFGFLACHLEPTEWEMPTAGTDGVKLFYNPETIKAWAEEDIDLLCGVLCHEVLHAALGHLWRKESRQQLAFNAACDFAINPIVLDAPTVPGAKLKLPKGELFDPKYEGMSAEQIYASFPVAKMPQAGDGFCAGVLDPAPGEGGIKGKAEGKETGQGAGTGDKEDKGEQGGQDDGPANTEQIWRRRLVQAAEAAKLQGKLPGGLERLVDELVNPVLPWRDILRNLVNTLAKSDYRMMPPAKNHIWRGIYLPSVRSESIELVVALDTSGSIGEAELASFAGEVRGMCAALGDYTIHLLACDTAVHGHWELTPFSEEVPKAFGGGGGTSHIPIFQWIEDKQLRPACLICFTDAFTSFPDNPPDYPVIWVLTKDHREVPWGYPILTDFGRQEGRRR